jgi:hypothetical protein
MKLSKLNVSGFSHIVVPLAVILLVAVAGVYTLVASHADSCLNPGATKSASGVVSGVVSGPVSAPVSAPICPTTKGVATIAGFSRILDNTQYGMSVFACKTYINAYGGVYNVKYVFTKPAKLQNASYQLTGARNNAKPYYNAAASSWWNNVVASYATNMSALGAINDKLTSTIKVNNKSVGSISLIASRVQGQPVLDPSLITNCLKK